jgi:hypothetical protein
VPTTLAAANVSVWQPHVENAELAKRFADDLQGGISHKIGKVLQRLDNKGQIARALRLIWP